MRKEEKRVQLTENRLSLLLCLNSGDERRHTITGLAEELEISKAAVSKSIDVFAEEGYVAEKNSRIIELTPFGRREARRCEREVELFAYYLAENAHDPASPLIRRNAAAMAVHLSDEVKEPLLTKIQRNKIFDSKAMEKEEVSIRELVKGIEDGEYPVSYVIFRENWEKKNYFSMADGGFRHPAVLQVQKGECMLILRSVRMERRNILGKLIESGRLMRMEYEGAEGFVPVKKEGDVYRIPAEALSYRYHRGEGLLTGAGKMKFYAPLGNKAIHARNAVLVVLIRNG